MNEPIVQQFPLKYEVLRGLNPPLIYSHILLVHRCHSPLDLYQAHRDVVAALRQRGWVMVGSGAR